MSCSHHHHHQNVLTALTNLILHHLSFWQRLVVNNLVSTQCPHKTDRCWIFSCLQTVVYHWIGFNLVNIHDAFNKFPEFFVQAFKIVVDSWKFSMLLLYNLWDDWPFFYDFRYKSTATAGIGTHPNKAWLSQLVNFKMQSGREDTLEERHAIKLCFKLGKSVTETYRMLQTAFRPSCMNRASGFEWHKRFKEGRKYVRDYERCERSKEVNTLELIGQRVRVRVTLLWF